MKKTIVLFFVLLIAVSMFADTMYKPYILGAKSNLSMIETIENLKFNLQKNNLELVGEYEPAKDETRYILVVTNEDLKSSVKEIGGLAGLGAAIRIGITSKDNQIEISYVNPKYLALAYFREDYEKISDKIDNLEMNLQKSMAGFNEELNLEFGSEKGLKAKKLKKYKYMVGMPKFESVVELAEFESYDKALETINANLAKSQTSSKVYQIDFPEEKITLYGVALSGEDGEEKFLPIIDITEPKHTAFLPYEMLVIDNKAVMLHGRYRIALSFPDLTMGTFMKIMSTPGEIKEGMRELTK